MANEISILQQLQVIAKDHPNFVQVFDFLILKNRDISGNPENLYINAEIGVVMEYLPYSLEEIMQSRKDLLQSNPEIIRDILL